MCRFLIVKSKKPIKPKTLLQDFAAMCKKNTDWQGDGWGIAYKNESVKIKSKKSLRPIWEDKDQFEIIPQSQILVVHARGASFPNQKGDIDYNQPYIDGDLCFVFNGELYGVKIKSEGRIGAQKIFNLLRSSLENSPAEIALESLGKLLRRRSRSLLGVNIAFVRDSSIYARCDFDKRPDYYTIRYVKEPDITMICSGEIGKYNWRRMKKGGVIKL